MRPFQNALVAATRTQFRHRHLNRFTSPDERVLLMAIWFALCCPRIQNRLRQSAAWSVASTSGKFLIGKGFLFDRLGCANNRHTTVC